MSGNRVPIVAGNWKMHTSISEGVALTDAMLGQLRHLDGVDRVLCPPFVSLAAIAERVKRTEVRVGAQNMHWEAKGAYTGEVSASMLLGLATYVILGHSERRQYFCEDDAGVNRKVLAALAADLTPIICVGESLEQNERGETEGVVTGQTSAALAGVPPGAAFVIAYEPIWAIGTGRAATPEGANRTIALIRGAVRSALGGGAAEAVRIQYGGSVTPDNFAAFSAQPDIDGALVGGASLKADSFVEIVRLARANR